MLNNLLKSETKEILNTDKYIIVIAESPEKLEEIREEIIRQLGLFHLDLNSKDQIRVGGGRIEFMDNDAVYKLRGRHPGTVFVEKAVMDDVLRKNVYSATGTSQGDIVILDEY
jgi:hypothetical protein